MKKYIVYSLLACFSSSFLSACGPQILKPGLEQPAVIEQQRRAPSVVGQFVNCYLEYRKKKQTQVPEQRIEHTIRFSTFQEKFTAKKTFPGFALEMYYLAEDPSTIERSAPERVLDSRRSRILNITLAGPWSCNECSQNRYHFSRSEPITNHFGKQLGFTGLHTFDVSYESMDDGKSKRVWATFRYWCEAEEPSTFSRLRCEDYETEGDCRFGTVCRSCRWDNEEKHCSGYARHECL